MIFNVTGGGGAALNFKVLAYATEAELLAATPKENTIGVITQTPITSWIFSATEPSPAAAGMVWITIGVSSTVEFNALKKNGIQVYPISAKQYISSAWVDMPAYTYQGVEWAYWWNGELYDSGNEYESVTGGWTARAVAGNSSLTAANPTITRADDRLTINLNGTGQGGAVVHEDAVDFTDFTTLTVVLSDHVVTGSYSQINLVVYDESNSAVITQRAYLAGTHTVDVSALDGLYKAGIHLAAADGSCTVSINSMILS